MLLDSATLYEGRHGRNATNGDHRGAKSRLEAFLAGANPCNNVLTGRDLTWFQEWLNSRNAYGAGPLWQGLYTQIDFAISF